MLDVTPNQQQQEGVQQDKRWLCRGFFGRPQRLYMLVSIIDWRTSISSLHYARLMVR